MAKVWVLDTETKGTGANVVPLEKVLTKRSSVPEPLFVPRKPRPRPPEAPAPRPPREFKIVDLMTRQVLAEGVSARETIDVLGGIRSIVDVSIYVWHPERDRWRMLTLDEMRALWKHRAG
jgi:hypothetical protein